MKNEEQKTIAAVALMKKQLKTANISRKVAREELNEAKNRLLEPGATERELLHYQTLYNTHKIRIKTCKHIKEAIEAIQK